jgi:hypothetical protein
MKHDSNYWSKKFEVTVLDPDGWDRANFDVSWSEEIDEEEFKKRLQRSTSLRLPKKEYDRNESTVV